MASYEELNMNHDMHIIFPSIFNVMEKQLVKVGRTALRDVNLYGE